MAAGIPVEIPAALNYNHGHEPGTSTMRILIAGLVVILLVLNIHLWRSDDTGVRQMRALQAAVEVQRMENSSLDERNRALEAEVKSLKEDLEAIEERARAELGMIRDDETFFYVLESEGNESQSVSEAPVN